MLKVKHLPVVVLSTSVILAGSCWSEDRPEPRVFAHYQFNGDGKDATQVHPDFELRNTEFRNNALYLNGRYEFNVEKGGYRAICQTSGLDIEQFSVALRLRVSGAEASTTSSNLLTGGAHSHRWFGLERSRSGNLVVMLNNGQFQREVKGAVLEQSQWTVVACSVDIPGRKVLASVNGKKVTVIPVPQDFEMVSLPAGLAESQIPKDVLLAMAKTKAELKDRDIPKEWTFTNYGHGGVFHGLVDELLIYSHALDANELKLIPLQL